jgi:hypothetical protein
LRFGAGAASRGLSALLSAQVQDRDLPAKQMTFRFDASYLLSRHVEEVGDKWWVVVVVVAYRNVGWRLYLGLLLTLWEPTTG